MKNTNMQNPQSHNRATITIVIAANRSVALWPVKRKMPQFHSVIQFGIEKVKFARQLR